MTNKAAIGKKGAIVAMVAGTTAETVIAIIEKIPLKQRNLVTEITLDMARNIGLIAKKSWVNHKSWGGIKYSRYLRQKIGLGKLYRTT
ncbi:hypothetical protein [Flavobacterium muglaense]|uniref:hypothetical protein n=1 Tax=Flavobacterium muglaense TaxID=2764716 RepID=UPI00293BAFA1|nr:hypothetical protein [Flavobacterium muglaense]